MFPEGLIEYDEDPLVDCDFISEHLVLVRGSRDAGGTGDNQRTGSFKTMGAADTVGAMG